MMHMQCWVSALFLGYSIFQVIVFLLGCSLLGKQTAYSSAATVVLLSHCPYKTSISKYSEEVNIKRF
jgi:hypothetical protein